MAKQQHPILLIIRGLPGSGKTYLADALVKKLGAEDVVSLDPDATDYQSPEYQQHVRAQETEGVEPSLHAYRFLRAQAYQGIAEHKIIIWNQPFTNLEIFMKMIDRLETQARECQTSLPILVVEVDLDPATAKERVEDRKSAGGHGPSDNTFAKRVNEYKTFADEGYNVLRINGSGNISESVDSVLKALVALAQK